LPARPHISQKLYEVERKVAPQFTKVVLGLSVAFMLTALLAPNLRLSQPDYKVGDIAARNVKAQEDYLVEDVQATEKRLETAKEVVPPVFDLDSALLGELSRRVEDAFLSAGLLDEEAITGKKGEEFQRRALEKYREFIEARGLQSGFNTRGSSDPEVLESEVKAMRARVFGESLQVDVDESSMRIMEDMGYKTKVEGYIIDALKAVMNKGLVGDDKEYLFHSANGVIVRDLATGEETVVKDTSSILNRSSLKMFLNQFVTDYVPDEPIGLKSAVRHIAGQLVRPNLAINMAETRHRVQSAAGAVKPVYFKLRKGEIILREGDPINEEQLMKLQGMVQATGGNKMLFTWLGLLVLVITILYLGWIYLSKFKHWMIRSNRQLILLSAIFAGNMVIIKAALYIAASMAENQSIITQTSFYYAAPFAIGAMLAAILFDMEIAMLFSVATFILVGVLIKDNLSFPLLALVGSLVASFRGKHYRQRTSLLTTGVFIGTGNLAIVVSADLINHTLFTAHGGFDAIMGFLGGVVVGIIVSGILPIFESLFNMATDIKLLELSDPNHPLLRKLVVQAPGTYHHSVIVGSLAEEAAKNVGASELFVRVASYYHDVGKTFKPEYFIENQQESENKHDKLAPSMSSLVLMAHVKDGAELAREHKLPTPIVDIIRQHHGTSLISFFYNKAREQNSEGHQQVDENDFRYQGPKPQSKEAAIVLLADSVEAASRTLEEPSQTRLGNLAQRIVNQHFIDGQLDDCDLSLKDLHIIVESFVRILAAIFHQRISYPGQEEETEEIPDSVPHLDFSGRQTKQVQGGP